MLYKNLVSDIEAVFTVENLQRKSPTMSVCEVRKTFRGFFRLPHGDRESIRFSSSRRSFMLGDNVRHRVVYSGC